MKRWIALLLAAALALGCAACGGTDAPEEDDLTILPFGLETPEKPAENKTEGEGFLQRLMMTVNRDTGELTVSRMDLPEQQTGEPGKWTILVYLCGSDLESQAGGATDDLIEMLDGAVGENFRYVVQTGGAYEWLNDLVTADTLQRYLVEGEDIELVDEQPRAGMGRQATLESFLRWGVENYASEHMAVVFWDHGGGSISGVCFDETDDFDSLSLRELDGALFSVCGETGRKFDFIGFDACLMATLETANILASYADYMVASQETEPGAGWDYAALGSYLAAQPEATAAEVGASLCEGFLASCRAVEDEDLCTLAAIDLGKIDTLLVRFNDFAHGLYNAAADTAVCAEMVRGIHRAENFGGNNRSEGYTNMVDLGGLVSACEGYADGARETREALSDAVSYAVRGSAHADASGLSVYFPLSVQGSEELGVFGEICPSPYYLSFADRQNQSGVYGTEVDYDDDAWFDEDGGWTWGGVADDGYWNYLDGFEPTGESPFITFAVAPHLDEEGDFWFLLDESGYACTADVCGVVYELSADGKDLIELGQTYDLSSDWASGFFMDDFDGWWISLPDGQNLATYIVEDTADYMIYTSPVLLNGEETNLRLKLDYVNTTLTIEGAWNGVDESGAAAREIVRLQSGDVITPLYYAYALEDLSEFRYQGWEYTFTGAPELNYDLMEDGDYLFAFRIDDIFGDYCLTDFAAFTVENGEVWFTPAAG